MSKTKIEYTNHRDPKKIGTVVEVDSGHAKRLLKEGLAVETKRNLTPVKKTDQDDTAAAKSEPAKAK